MNALVVDDSRAIRTILRHILVEFGFTVREASNGREGIESLNREGNPDIVFIDWNMPVMNGLDFVLAVRGDASKSAMPLIMVTTETEIESVSRALDAGANEYIMKPFDREIVREKLEILGITVS